MSRVDQGVKHSLWLRLASAVEETVRIIVTCGVPGKRGSAVRKQAIIEELQKLTQEAFKQGIETGYDMACHVHRVGHHAPKAGDAD